MVEPIADHFNDRSEVELQKRFTTTESREAARVAIERTEALLQRADAQHREKLNGINDEPKPEPPRPRGAPPSRKRETDLFDEHARFKSRTERIITARDNTLRRIEERQQRHVSPERGPERGKERVPSGAESEREKLIREVRERLNRPPDEGPSPEHTAVAGDAMTKRFTIELTDDEAARLDDLAGYLNQSATALLTDWVRVGLSAAELEREVHENPDRKLPTGHIAGDLDDGIPL